MTSTAKVDALRGLAILTVVAYHLIGACYNFRVPWEGWVRGFSSVPQLAAWTYPVSFGWVGVSLFFVISGFCIHLSFLRAKSFNSANFFWRRFWRIYPAYLAALVVFFYFSKFSIFTKFGSYEFFSHALLVHNLRESAFFGINASFWSLAVEFQLYLLFPLLIFLRSKVGIGNCLLITFAIGCVWRAIAVSRWGLPDHLISPAFTSPFMTWFDWTLGAYVADRFFEGREAFSRRRIWLAVLLPLFVLSTLYQPASVFSFSLASGVAAVILDGVLAKELRMATLSGWLAGVGAVSYSLYLWHQPVLQWLQATFGSWRMVVISGPAVLLLLILSYVSFLMIEQNGVKTGSALREYVIAIWGRWRPSVSVLRGRELGEE